MAKRTITMTEKWRRHLDARRDAHVAASLKNYVVNKERGCWEWSGVVGTRGYGKLNADGQHWLAHRFFYDRLIAPIPPGMFVCHRCDNPRCVNPEHLFLGSHSDNMRDAMRKGRRPVGGEEVYTAKLTNAQVAEMRSKGGPTSDWARRFGVTQAAIADAMTGRTFQTVDVAPNRPPPHRGRHHERAKLSEDAVFRMRKERAGGATFRELAARFGVSLGIARRACRGFNWKHADGEVDCAARYIPKGSGHHNSKLTEDAVRVIRAGGSARELAERFGVSKSLVLRVRAGVGWSHVT